MGVDYLVIVVPLVAILIALKPPGRSQVDHALDAWAWSAIAASATALVLGAIGSSQSSFDVSSGALRLGFFESLGASARWFGPFIHSNLAGPVGAAIVVIGLMRRGRTRWAFVIGGAVILALSQSRTGIGALVVALMTWVLIERRGSAARRWVLSLGTAAIALTYIALVDPTLAWRTYAWLDYLGLWLRFPLLGAPPAAIDAYMHGNPVHGPVTATHAHNLLIDQAARWGLVAALLTGGALAACMAAGWRAARIGSTQGFVLTTLVITTCVVETPFTWLAPAPMLVLLLLALASSGAVLGSPATEGAAARLRGMFTQKARP